MYYLLLNEEEKKVMFVIVIRLKTSLTAYKIPGALGRITDWGLSISEQLTIPAHPNPLDW